MVCVRVCVRCARMNGAKRGVGSGTLQSESFEDTHHLICPLPPQPLSRKENNRLPAIAGPLGDFSCSSAASAADRGQVMDGSEAKALVWGESLLGGGAAPRALRGAWPKAARGCPNRGTTAGAGELAGQRDLRVSRTSST